MYICYILSSTDSLIPHTNQLPDAFKDFATNHAGGKGPSGVFFTHCHRDFLHAQWEILLDEDFLHAYKHGIVITCCDGIRRRFYPRIFTYSADYPEKYVHLYHLLLSCIINYIFKGSTCKYTKFGRLPMS
jgi:hypothetical protein